MLSNSERTVSVIRKAMEKHGFEGNPEDYTLAQFLPDGGKFSDVADIYISCIGYY